MIATKLLTSPACLIIPARNQITELYLCQDGYQSETDWHWYHHCMPDSFPALYIKISGYQEDESPKFNHRIMNSGYGKLDNPVWYALSETHAPFSIDYNLVKFYDPDYCPFGGTQTIKSISRFIDEYAELVDNFFLVGEKPELSNQLRLKQELVCLQMVVRNKITLEFTEEITGLTNEHFDDLLRLINLVQPGYFKRKTALLGNYFGIFKNGELVSVTGERMKMNDFIEVSAIVTHPDHTGQGYAKQLIAHTVNNIFNLNKIPFLHVVENNSRAIKLYEKLGFTTRRKISFWNVVK